MDEIRIQSNAQHCFNKKRSQECALIHCTSVQWDLESQHLFHTFFFHPNLRKIFTCSFGEFIHCIFTPTDDAKVQVLRNFD